jgi:hypothetical protein
MNRIQAQLVCKFMLTYLHKIKGSKAVSPNSINPPHSYIMLHSEVGQHLQHLWRGTPAH